MCEAALSRARPSDGRIPCHPGLSPASGGPSTPVPSRLRRAVTSARDDREKDLAHSGCQILRGVGWEIRNSKSEIRNVCVRGSPNSKLGGRVGKPSSPNFGRLGGNSSFLIQMYPFNWARRIVAKVFPSRILPSRQVSRASPTVIVTISIASSGSASTSGAGSRPCVPYFTAAPGPPYSHLMKVSYPGSSASVASWGGPSSTA